MNYTLASDSDIDMDEVFLEDDIHSETLEDQGYSNQLEDISSLLVINIFAMGILAGLIVGGILWRKL